MEPDQVLVKTDKGREEIKTRTLALSQAARTLLIASDGQKTVRSMTELFARMPGISGMLQELVDHGLIELRGGAAASSQRVSLLRK
ncbi:MAG TPA: hypothetical protein VHE37_13185 [Nevskiaceae bacterium]|nr:hypothetical protein [Nevskiaceae bacterium]